MRAERKSFLDKINDLEARESQVRTELDEVLTKHKVLRHELDRQLLDAKAWVERRIPVLSIQHLITQYIFFSSHLVE